jgi:hypothetical protein
MNEVNDVVVAGKKLANKFADLVTSGPEGRQLYHKGLNIQNRDVSIAYSSVIARRSLVYAQATVCSWDLICLLSHKRKRFFAVNVKMFSYCHAREMGRVEVQLLLIPHLGIR